jgi:hypothetical protein
VTHRTLVPALSALLVAVALSLSALAGTAGAHTNHHVRCHAAHRSHVKRARHACAGKASATGVADRLSEGRTSVEVAYEPTGTTSLHVAVMADLAGNGVRYLNLPASQRTYAPPTGTPVVDVLAYGSYGPIGGWAGRLATVPGRSGIADRLSGDHASVEVTALPAGTTTIHAAVMTDMAGDGVRYVDLPVTQRTYTPPAATPVVDLVAAGANGVIGGWAGRVQTQPAEGTHAGFTPGLVLDSDLTSSATSQAVALGAHVIRAEFSIDSGPSAIQALQAAYPGVTVQPLAGFQGRIPTAAEARGLAAWAVPGVKLIEFGNETNYPNQLGMNTAAAAEYALRAREAAEALAPHGVGLLVQASDAGTGSSAWIDAMFAAVPDLAAHVAGWTIHPYFGGYGAGEADHWGLPMMERLVGQLARHGDTRLPIYATEWGIPSSPFGTVFSSGQRETYAEAAQIVEQQVPRLQAAAQGRLAELLLYQAHDQQPVGQLNRELYFGALTSTGAAKEPFTRAVRALLAS